MIDSFLDKRGRNDGFVDRFLFAYPDRAPRPSWSDTGIPDEVVNEWAAIIGRLYAVPMRIENGKATPQVVHLSPEGRAAWRELHDVHQTEADEAGFPLALTGPWDKIREYAGRFLPALHMLGLAADPARSMSVIPDVTPETVRNAWRLATYFKSHAARVHGVHRGDTSVNPAVKPAGVLRVEVLLVKFMETRSDWQGRCTTLLEELTNLGGDAKPQEGWPTDPIRLSKVLHDLVPVMQTLGFELEFPRRKHDGRSVHIRRMVPLGVDGQLKDKACDAPADPAEECPPPSPDDREVFDL